MTINPPTRNVPCAAIESSVPVPVLVWTEYQKDHFCAEPIPGYQFFVMPDPDTGLWIFHLPGKPPTPCTRRDIATYASEVFWYKAMKKLLNLPGVNKQ